MKIVVIGGYAPSLINFRAPLLKALREQGHSVTACAPGQNDEVRRQLAELDIEYAPLRFERAGMNPISDATGILQLYLLLRKIRPDLVLNYTIKPVIYGSLAARAAGVRSVCSIITGLGYVFTKESTMQRAVRALYRTALRRNDVAFFQNNDDREEFERLGIVPIVETPGTNVESAQQREARGASVDGASEGRPKVIVISGSGVDLDHFSASDPPSVAPGTAAPSAELTSDAPATDGQTPAGLGPVFLLIARLLRDKGILEFAEVAKSLKEKYPHARFQLLGAFDSNPAALNETELNAIVATAAVEYLGETADVRPYLAACDVYVLPSYREGTPRTVLEAMATGRAIITTDAPGCRETVRRGAPRDGKPVASASVAGMPKAGTSKTDALTSNELTTDSPPTGVHRGANGFLVPVRDVKGLKWVMEQFIVRSALIVEMGRRSREYAEERYDVHKVNAVILRELGLAEDDVESR